jgi:hypothetical protein
MESQLRGSLKMKKRMNKNKMIVIVEVMIDKCQYGQGMEIHKISH